jgi:O-methyltransferase
MSDALIHDICRPFTMISRERLAQNLKSVEHIEASSISGDIVEIGVWKGGSMLSMVLKYATYQKKERHFHLYDTFTGMTPPTENDFDHNGNHASTIFHMPSVKAECPYSDVLRLFNKFSLNDISNIHFHVGDIMKNTYVPERIAILRLDTDFYDSTKHELETFYPAVASGGIVMIDDYGHWKGCRKAVDEFLAEHPEITIHKIDYTGVYFIKP